MDGADDFARKGGHLIGEKCLGDQGDQAIGNSVNNPF